MSIQELEIAVQYSLPVEPVDVVHARMKFPFVRMFHPLGFPVELSSNSERVLEIASETWGQFHRLYDRKPTRIQIGVVDGYAIGCPPAPTCRVQQHLFTFVADQNNFGFIDMVEGFCGIWVTSETVEHASYLRHYFLECAMICPISTRLATGVHSGCVSRNGKGVLLCGDTGAGKTTLTYACAKAGWTYTTDDGSYIVHGVDGLEVVGNCYQVRFRPAAQEFFPEVEGREIIKRAAAGKPSIELRPDSIPDLRVAQVANVECMVVLNRRDGVNAPLRPYSKDVVRAFLQQGRFAPPKFMSAHQEAVDRLLKHDVFELRYTDLDWAITQLEKLAEG